MSEDTSLSQSAPPEDNSLASSTVPVTEVAPVNVTQTDTTPPQQANAGETSAQAGALDGAAGGGVNIDDYEAARAAYLSGTVQPEAAPLDEVQPPQVNAEVNAPNQQQTLPAIKVKPESQADLELLSLYKKEGNGMGLVEFILKREQIQVPGADTTTATVNPETGQPETVVKPAFTTMEDVDAEIRRLEDLEDKALENFDPKQARAHKREQEKLKAYKLTLQEVQSHADRVEQTAFEQDWQSSLGKARLIHPEAGQEGSPLETKAIEVRQRWVKEGHPLAYRADSAVALYAEAAAELASQGQAAPVGAGPPAINRPVVTPPPAIPRRGAPSVIAGGDARTTPRAPIEVTAENYDEVMTQYLGRAPRRL